MKGEVEWYAKDKEGNWYLTKKGPNLFVDDGKELALDFMFGRKSWWNPDITENYEPQGSETAEWKARVYLGIGECMFNNASKNTRNGTYAIPSGSQYDYQVSNTWLVSPEDSFLSSELSGTRGSLSVTRRDQQVEMSLTIEPDVHAPNGSYIRECGVFLSSEGPDEDPSLRDVDKPKAMICRSALFDTGYFDAAGNSYTEAGSGIELCYDNDPVLLDEEIKLRWTFGEL